MKGIDGVTYLEKGNPVAKFFTYVSTKKKEKDKEEKGMKKKKKQKKEKINKEREKGSVYFWQCLNSIDFFLFRKPSTEEEKEKKEREKYEDGDHVAYGRRAEEGEGEESTRKIEHYVELFNRSQKEGEEGDLRRRRRRREGGAFN